MTSIEGIRKRFPALQQTDQIYFDNAGGSQTLGTVVDDIRDYLCRSNVQLGASYAVGKKATEKYSEGFKAAARYVNAHVDEVAIGPSTTQLLRNLSWTLKLQPGDELIVSWIDHEANIAPWVDLAERQGLVLKWWKPTPSKDPRLEVQDLWRLLTSKTKLVTCTHASNVLGTITDVRAIADVAHRVGALVCVDGVAYAPHRPIDVKALGVDFYCFSWYKVYGPHVAMLYASWAAQTQMKSLGHFFNPHVTLVDKLGLAGASYELLQAVPSVVDYLHGDDAPSNGLWPTILKIEAELQSRLLAFLTSRNEVTIYGSESDSNEFRLPTVSFTIEGMSSKDVVETVEAKTQHAFRWGAFYSNRLVRETLQLDQDGVVRVSMVHYNTGTFPPSLSYGMCY